MNGSRAEGTARKKVARLQPAHVDEETEMAIRRVRGMPAEVGILLIVSGIGGILLPGPVGTPFLVLGCLMLWPKAFRQTERCVEKRFPRMHRHGVKQINRFLDDLERRYPVST